MRRSLLLSGIAILLAVLCLSETATQAQDRTATQAQDRAEWRFFVAGAVLRPGKFDLGKQVTLRQALALAEGLTNKAVKRAVIIRQDQASDKLVEITVDLAAVMKGQAQDVPLLPDDVIIVPKQRP